MNERDPVSERNHVRRHGRGSRDRPHLPPSAARRPRSGPRHAADPDGGPPPVAADLTTASLHFLDLHAIVPRILADKQRLVGLYRAAEAQLDPGTDAHQVTQRLAEAQRDHLAALQRLAKAREEAVSSE